MRLLRTVSKHLPKQIVTFNLINKWTIYSIKFQFHDLKQTNDMFSLTKDGISSCFFFGFFLIDLGASLFDTSFFILLFFKNFFYYKTSFLKKLFFWILLFFSYFFFQFWFFFFQFWFFFFRFSSSVSTVFFPSKIW